jgi:hypothetical protein
LTGRAAKVSKFGKAVPPFDSNKTQASLKQQVKIQIQLQNNNCTFQLDLMCTLRLSTLLLKGMAWHTFFLVQSDSIATLN